MNSRQKEVISASLDDEKAILDALEKNYANALADIKRNIRELQSNPLTQSKAYQLDFQRQLEKQISGILDNLSGKNFTSIADYLNTCYRTGFIGAMYDMQGQGVPLVLPINQDQVLKAIQKTSDDIKLVNKVGVCTNELKKQVLDELQRGFATDLTYTDIARNISSRGQANMARSMTIARTEGHRVQSEAKMDSYHAAKAKGADIVKQWDATLDSSTRDTHRLLDGQVREIDEDFTVMGMSAPYPGGFGDPAEDCNCRCCMLQRARWAVDDETSYDKWNNETGGIIQCTGYKDFEEKYLKAAENLTEHAESDKISTGIDVLDSAKRLEHHDIDDCFDTTNPHFTEGEEYQRNCQRCVSAYEARRRGYDVTASERIFDGTDNLPYVYRQGGFVSVYKDGLQNLESLSGSRASAIKESICQRMAEFGDGARAMIIVDWQGGNAGHVFIAEQVNGITQFIDPQVGSRDCSDYFRPGMIRPSATKMLRIDDKEFTDLIEKCVKQQ